MAFNGEETLWGVRESSLGGRKILEGLNCVSKYLWKWSLRRTVGFLHNKVLSSEGREEEFSTSVFNICNRGQSDQDSLNAFTQREGNTQTVNTEIMGEINCEEFSQITWVFFSLMLKTRLQGSSKCWVMSQNTQNVFISTP